MRKLIRFIKDNPLVKGKYTFLSLIFFFSSRIFASYIVTKDYAAPYALIL